MPASSVLRRHVLAQATTAGRLAFETTIVLGGAAVVGVLVALAARAQLVERDQASVVLALLAACAGSAAVGFGHTAGRIAGNRRADWLIPALALYCVVVVPGTAMLPAATGDAPVPNAGLLVAYVMIMLLIVAGVLPPRRWGSKIGWVVACATAVVAAGLHRVDVGPAHVPTAHQVGAGLLVAWFVVSIAVVVSGYRAGSAPLWRMGLGFGIIAPAHLYLLVLRDQALTEPSLVFATLRLLGVLVVLFGARQLLRRNLNDVLSERFDHQEDIRLATLRLEQAARTTAERDHELRNCLSGLSGIATMLGTEEGDGARELARSAVRSEFVRMSELLDGRSEAVAPGLYDAGRVVLDLAALWQLTGMRVTSTAPEGLIVTGRPATLAQALTNVLANCARHAPGTDVTIAARRRGVAVTVQVRDNGPHPSSVGPGGRTARPGARVGLAISRRLVEADGGELTVLPANGDRPGFTVVITLRALPAPRSEPADGPMVAAVPGTSPR
ncbi:MAG: HAMP domain-containing histidine kinase [Actinomycetia bacterium]|nr:HAMP domain-containing histidine kinase [Actinomycetes bacterium]